MNTKKIFIIALIFLVLVAGSLLVYNLFFKASSQNNGENNGVLPSAPGGRESTSASPSGGGDSPGIGGTTSDSRLKIISQEKVMSPVIGEDGKTVKYYAKSNGNVIESDFIGGNLKKVSSVTLNNLLKVLWSPDKEKIIGIFADGTKTKKNFYDYNSGQTALLNSNIGYVAWSPDSKKIAYQYTDPNQEQSNISTSNPDGTGYKNIFKTRLEGLVVDWPTKEKISIRLPASGLAQGILYTINSDSGDFNKVLSDIFGLNIKWSLNGEKVLFSFTDSQGKDPQIKLADSTGTKIKSLELAGIVDKCVWSKDNKTIYCALPQEISGNAVWPDDYYKKRVILADDFYKIDLETGSKTKVLGSSSEFSYDALELLLSPKEDYLFFVNQYNGLLYSLKL